jgi:hypothetical protein
VPNEYQPKHPDGLLFLLCYCFLAVNLCYLFRTTCTLKLPNKL